MKCKEAKTEGCLAVKDDVANREAKQQCLRGTDGEAVTMETAPSVDVETNDDGCSDSESDEVEDGELVSSSSSESELELEEAVHEKGKRLSVSASCDSLFFSSLQSSG